MNKILTTPPQGIHNTSIIKGWDILKFLMAILVVDIHSGTTAYWSSDLLRGINKCMTSIAVPVFFVLSSYFVFNKIRQTDSKNAVIRFEKRVNTLYLSWILLLLPVIIRMWHSEYIHNNVITTVGLFVKNYFFAYQFGASWFLGSLIIGVPFIYVLTKIFKEYFVWMVPLVVYLYLYLADENHFIFAWYENTIRTPLLSFPSGLLWLCIGYYITNEVIKKLLLRLSNSFYIMLLALYLLLGIFFEHWLFLVKVPAVISIIMLFYKIDFDIAENKCVLMRNSSIIIFCLHFSLICIISRLQVFECKPLLFIVAFTISFICSILIIQMSKRFRLLKNLY